MAVLSFSLSRRPIPGINFGLLDAITFSVSCPGGCVSLSFLSDVLFVFGGDDGAAPPLELLWPPPEPVLDELLSPPRTVMLTLSDLESALDGVAVNMKVPDWVNDAPHVDEELPSGGMDVIVSQPLSMDEPVPEMVTAIDFADVSPVFWMLM